MTELRYTGPGHTYGPNPVVLTGTAKNDYLKGGNSVAEIRGRAGHDILHAGVFGGTVSGGHGNDIIHLYGFGANKPQQFQTHAFGEWGDDTFYLGLARQPGDDHNLRFGHHIFGGHGADKFVFSNLANNSQRIIGRIDDFNPSEDSIWLDNARIDLTNLPKNVRIVEYEDQQWILINGRILYALEGARHASSTVSADDRNAAGSEENHFVDWPAEWVAGVPTSADVVYTNPINFVPSKFLRDNFDYGPTFSPKIKSFTGTENNDRIEGSSDYDQIISGRLGNDFIAGNRGNDILKGDSGHDYIDGGHGRDRISGGYGGDTLNGNKGHDEIYGGYGNDVIAGGSDNDRIFGGHGNDTVFGGSESDLIFGNEGMDLLLGGPGNDTVSGGAYADTIHGGSGNDKVFGDKGDDLIHGGRGNDWLNAGEGNDVLHGGLGNDVIYGGAGIDRLHGGIGSDTFVFRNVNDSRAGKEINYVADFMRGQDKIDFTGFDANLNANGVQGLQFSDEPERFSLWGAENKLGTFIRIDVSGDRVQDFAIFLEGAHNIVGTDFIL